MIIDIIVGAVVIVSAIISFLRGFIREVLTIAGVVGGLAAAYFMGPMLTPTFKDWFGVDPEAEEMPSSDIILYKYCSCDMTSLE